MQTVEPTYAVYLTFAILLALIGVIVSSAFSYWLLNQKPSLSPYSKLPLRRASDISYESKGRVLRFLFDIHQYHNPMFDFDKAAFCRETGRIFSNAVTWYGAIKLDWTFLTKRYPGNYVSWGSLSDYQQEIIRSAHHSIEGYQTEYSSREAAPSKVEAFYAKTIPGPLYVDLDTKVLLGWKSVPLTDLEVLVVQKPREIFELPKFLQ